jgi:hypothetical protein
MALFSASGVMLSSDDKGVLTLSFTRGENVVNPEYISCLKGALDAAVNAPQPKVREDAVWPPGRRPAAAAARQRAHLLTAARAPRR